MYLRSKGQGEAALMQAAKGGADGGDGTGAGFALTVLRPSVIFGAEDKFLNLFAKLQKVFPLMPLAGAHAKFQPVWVQDVAAAVVCSLQDRAAALQNPRVVELCGPDVYTLKELVQMAGRFSSADFSGANAGRGRPVLPLPRWVGYLQALCMECLPGAPLMSRDNLDSMKVDNVHTPGMPGLQSFGLAPAALQPIAQQYLSAHLGNAGLLALRKGARP
jgi:NADH dehydrogenase